MSVIIFRFCCSAHCYFLFFLVQNFFSTNKEADKIRHVQKQVDEVKDVMMENIGNLSHPFDECELYMC